MKRPKLTCPTCAGEGTCVLSKPLFQTLQALNRVGSATAETLHAQMKCSDIGVTAMNNRLSDLLKLKLVTRARAGHAWEYTVAK